MRDKVTTLVIILLLLIGTGCGIYKWSYSQKGEEFTRESIKMAKELNIKAPQPVKKSDEPEEKETREADGYEKVMEELKEINSDTIGWLYVEDSLINYPVVQGEDNEHYLRRSFHNEEDIRGALFMDWEVNMSRSRINRLIYGHNMKDGTMLADLSKYKDEDFYKEHPRFFWINDSGERESYYIIGAFYWDAGQTDFEYHTYVDFIQRSRFDEYIEKVKALSIYEMGEPSEKRELMTLSTCDYRTGDSRFVVVGQLE